MDSSDSTPNKKEVYSQPSSVDYSDVEHSEEPENIKVMTVNMFENELSTRQRRDSPLSNKKSNIIDSVNGFHSIFIDGKAGDKHLNERSHGQKYDNKKNYSKNSGHESKNFRDNSFKNRGGNGLRNQANRSRTNYQKQTEMLEPWKHDKFDTYESDFNQNNREKKDNFINKPRRFHDNTKKDRNEENIDSLVKNLMYMKKCNEEYQSRNSYEEQKSTSEIKEVVSASIDTKSNKNNEKFASNENERINTMLKKIQIKKINDYIASEKLNPVIDAKNKNEEKKRYNSDSESYQEKFAKEKSENLLESDAKNKSEVYHKKGQKINTKAGCQTNTKVEHKSDTKNVSNNKELKNESGMKTKIVRQNEKNNYIGNQGNRKKQRGGRNKKFNNRNLENDVEQSDDVKIPSDKGYMAKLYKEDYNELCNSSYSRNRISNNFNRYIVHYSENENYENIPFGNQDEEKNVVQNIKHDNNYRKKQGNNTYNNLKSNKNLTSYFGQHGDNYSNGSHTKFGGQTTSNNNPHQKFEFAFDQRYDGYIENADSRTNENMKFTSNNEIAMATVNVSKVDDEKTNNIVCDFLSNRNSDTNRALESKTKNEITDKDKIAKNSVSDQNYTAHNDVVPSNDESKKDQDFCAENPLDVPEIVIKFVVENGVERVKLFLADDFDSYKEYENATQPQKKEDEVQNVTIDTRDIEPTTIDGEPSFGNNAVISEAIWVMEPQIIEEQNNNATSSQQMNDNVNQTGEPTNKNSRINPMYINYSCGGCYYSYRFDRLYDLYQFYNKFYNQPEYYPAVPVFVNPPVPSYSVVPATDYSQQYDNQSNNNNNNSTNNSSSANNATQNSVNKSKRL